MRNIATTSLTHLGDIDRNTACIICLILKNEVHTITRKFTNFSRFGQGAENNRLPLLICGPLTLLLSYRILRIGTECMSLSANE